MLTNKCHHASVSNMFSYIIAILGFCKDSTPYLCEKNSSVNAYFLKDFDSIVPIISFKTRGDMFLVIRIVSLRISAAILKAFLCDRILFLSVLFNSNDVLLPHRVDTAVMFKKKIDVNMKKY